MQFITLMHILGNSQWDFNEEALAKVRKNINEANKKKCVC